MTSPLILVNLKTIPGKHGQPGPYVAQVPQLVSRESGVTIGVAPTCIDLHPLCHHFDVPIYAQHVDGCDRGQTPATSRSRQSRRPAQAGSLVNHSECRLTLAEIEASVRAPRNHRRSP